MKMGVTARWPPLGNVVFAALCVVVGSVHLHYMLAGIAEAANHVTREFAPLPTQFLPRLYRFLPVILAWIMAAGLLAWRVGAWGKGLVAGGVVALNVYHAACFALLVASVTWAYFAYVGVGRLRALWRWRARSRKNDRNDPNSKAEPGEVNPRHPGGPEGKETPGTPEAGTKRPPTSVRQDFVANKRPIALAGGVLALVLGMAFLPFAQGLPAAAGAPPVVSPDPDAHLPSFEARRAVFVERYGSRSEVVKVTLNATGPDDVNERRVLRELNRILITHDGQDFSMLRLFRFLYLENSTHPGGFLSDVARAEIRAALLGAKYWFTEPGPTVDAIYWTENHQIAYHSSELLAGQLWRNFTFPRSNMTGAEHVAHAEFMANRWLDWRARYGFAEWHSNTYYPVDITALLNIHDFAENRTLATKAAMVLDLLLFDLANNWFKGTLATTMGRCYTDTKAGYAADRPAPPSGITLAAWLFLGLGRDHGKTGKHAEAIATTRYVPPPVLEAIARDAASAPAYEHKERSGVAADAGPAIGIPYDVEHLPFWWGLAAPISEWTIDTSFEVMETYDVDPAIVCGAGIPEVFQWGSRLRGINLSEYARLLQEVSRGVVLETTNTYTYRTPYYQLSGAQDRQKGYNGLQEHAWQATLTDHACVFTNAPGGISFKGGRFMGGWKPRATFHKNVGVIQYDRLPQTFEGRTAFYFLDSAINLLEADRNYNHAYFPTWAFDAVVERGHWVLGSADGGYVALYSQNPTFWASNHEIQSLGRKNCWIVELGSAAEYGSFANFTRAITAAPVRVRWQPAGYVVTYESPSRGEVRVAWDGPMTVAGAAVDLGPYARWDNAYSQTPHGARQTVIEFNGTRLTLDFTTVTRTTTPVSL